MNTGGVIGRNITLHHLPRHGEMIIPVDQAREIDRRVASSMGSINLTLTIDTSGFDLFTARLYRRMLTTLAPEQDVDEEGCGAVFGAMKLWGES